MVAKDYWTDEDMAAVNAASSGTGGRIMAVSRINEAGLNVNQYGNRNHY